MQGEAHWVRPDVRPHFPLHRPAGVEEKEEEEVEEEEEES